MGQVGGSRIAGDIAEPLQRVLRPLAQCRRPCARAFQPRREVTIAESELTCQLGKAVRRHVPSLEQVPWYTPPPMSERAGLLAGLAGAVGFALLQAAHQPELAYTALVAGLLAASLTSRLPLGWQIGIGVLLGAAFGMVEGSGVERVGVVGQIFIALLRMLIAPMILASIAYGIAGMGDVRRLGTLGARTFALYVATMALAVLTGLVLVNLVAPGAGGSLRDSAFFAAQVGDVDRGSNRPPRGRAAGSSGAGGPDAISPPRCPEFSYY